MPQGTPVKTTGEAVAELEAGAARLRQRLLEETGGDDFLHVLAAGGDQPIASRRWAGRTAGRCGVRCRTSGRSQSSCCRPCSASTAASSSA